MQSKDPKTTQEDIELEEILLSLSIAETTLEIVDYSGDPEAEAVFAIAGSSLETGLSLDSIGHFDLHDPSSAHSRTVVDARGQAFFLGMNRPGSLLAYDQAARLNGWRTLLSLRKLALSGDASAQYRLAIAFIENRLVKADRIKACFWAVRAAKQGHPGALCIIGAHRAQDKSEEAQQDSFRCFLLAATRNFVPAMVAVARHYEAKANDRAGLKTAVRWYVRAARRGSCKAMNDLAIIREKPDHAYHSPRKAFYWWRRSARQGNPTAMGRVAWCYLTGQGTDIDGAACLHWLKKAFANGYDVAANSRDDGKPKGLSDLIREFDRFIPVKPECFDWAGIETEGRRLPLRPRTLLKIAKDPDAVRRLIAEELKLYEHHATQTSKESISYADLIEKLSCPPDQQEKPAPTQH